MIGHVASRRVVAGILWAGAAAGVGARVREAFHAAALMSAAVMLVFTLVCQLVPAALVRVFSHDLAVVFALPAYLLSHRPGFEMRDVWYLSVATVLVQTGLNLWLLHREFDARLAFVPLPEAAPSLGPG